MENYLFLITVVGTSLVILLFTKFVNFLRGVLMILAGISMIYYFYVSENERKILNLKTKKILEIIKTDSFSSVINYIDKNTKGISNTLKVKIAEKL